MTVAVSAAINERLRIGQLAKATGINPRTLRYYETIGLLQPVARTSAGYRLYSSEAVDRLRFVRRGQRLGLTLKDIAAILKITDTGGIPCQYILSVIDRELPRIEAQIRWLNRLHHHLSSLKARMVDANKLGTVESGGLCPCIQEIDN